MAAVEEPSPMSPQALAELLERQLPVVDRRGEIIEAIGADWVRLRLPLREEYLSRDLPPGSGQVVFSGPVTIGFAETAMYACVHAAYGPAVLAITLSLNVSFLRVTGASDVLATARLMRRGKRMAFVEVELQGADADAACARVSACYSVRPLD